MKKNRKPALALTLVLLLALSAAAVYAGAAYTDLKESHWAHAAIKTMSEKEIVAGYPDGRFRPSGTVTYGEFIKMAVVTDTGKDPGNASSGGWARNYYDAAIEAGYFNRYDINAQQLSHAIPRGDMALIVSALLGDVTIKDYDKIEATVTDVDATVKHDYDIIKSYATGVLTGYPDGTFRPEGTLSRAEAATVIYRTIDESARQLPDLNGGENETPTGGTDIGKVIKNYKTYYLDLHVKQFTEPREHYPEESRPLVIYQREGLQAFKHQFLDYIVERDDDVTSQVVGECVRDFEDVYGAEYVKPLIDRYGREFTAILWVTSDKGYGTLEKATRYEYVTDMSKYKVTLGENRGTKWIDINGEPPLDLGWGNLYLMRDGEIIKFTQNGVYDDEHRMKEHIDITTVEYFVFTRHQGEEGVLSIMPNPLYVKK